MKVLHAFQMLEKLGVGDLFNETADFTTLSEQPGILFDDAVHKAKIQNDEEGKKPQINYLGVKRYKSASHSCNHCRNIIRNSTHHYDKARSHNIQNHTALKEFHY